jgi:hypothetical protein
MEARKKADKISFSVAVRPRGRKKNPTVDALTGNQGETAICRSSRGSQCRVVAVADKELGDPLRRQGFRITAHIDVGFGNWLTVRGHGAGLSWNRGISLKNEGPGEWSWESSGCGKVEFKLLLNDVLWERGDNHICCENFFDLVPHF